MGVNKKGLWAGISALSLAGLATQAIAQDTNSEVDSSGGLEEIVVTAQKRSENLQDVPISVAAVSSQMVENLRATTLEALQGSVPNVTITHQPATPNSAVFFIRGIGSIDSDPFAGSTVSIVVDGIPQYFNMVALANIYDIDRIEVLRGPQGTLFGANTTGGVVNVVNTQPQKDFGAKIDLNYGNYNHFKAGGMLNLPLSDTLAARLVVSHDKRDGFITNYLDGSDLGRRDVDLFRGALKYSPSSDFDITLSGEHVRGRNGGPPIVSGAVPGEATFVPEGFRGMYRSPCLPAGSSCNAPNKYVSAFLRGPTDADGNVVDPIDDVGDLKTYAGTLTINVRNTGIGDITAISGYKEFSLFEFTDYGSPIFLIDTERYTKGWQFSQELRTAIDVSDGIKLQLGGFYLKNHYNQYNRIRLDIAGPITYDLATDTAVKSVPGLFQLNLQDQDNYSISGFAQTYIDVTDDLRLQAGIRYTHENTKMLASTVTSISPTGVTTLTGTAPDGTPNILLGSITPPRVSKSWDNVGWKIGADYKITPDVMIYGFWARGFKSGGFAGRLGVPQDLGPFNPETVDSFEAGVKADLLARRLRLNLAGFYTNYRDMQLAQIYFVTDPETGNQTPGSTIVNAATSHIRGIEAELQAAPVRGLTINASLAYLDARYSKFPYRLPTGDILDLKGERLQNSPKWTSSIMASYEFPIAGFTGRLTGQYNYASKKLYTSIISTPRATIQPMHIVNANADLIINDRMKLGVYATNLFDNRYVDGVSDIPGTLGIVSYVPPRQYGVSASYEF